MKVLQKKSLKEVRHDAASTKLQKNMGVWDLVLLGLGAIIGTGIFVLTGLAAAQYAGPGITLSFLLGGVACIFTALAFAELAAMLPVAGSAYTYAYVTLGEIFAAFAGWTLAMVYALGSATVAAGWSGYVIGILEGVGVHIPDALVKIPSQGGIINLPAVLIVLGLSALLIRGTETASKLNGILVAVKLGAIALFVMAAFPHVNFDNWVPFAPHGIFGIVGGAGFVFMAYTGFDTLASAAEECRNPNRDLPLGIVGSLLGSAVLYILVAGLLTAIVPFESLNNPEPMAFALRSNGVAMGAKLVAAGAIAGMTTVILTQVFSLSRVFYVMARDGMMPKQFLLLHSKFSTPYFGVIVSAVAIALVAGFLPVSVLGQLSSMSTLIMFSMVSLGVIILRIKHPNEKRPFRCPAVYFVATASIILCLFLFSQLFITNWKPYLAFASLGFVVYGLYGFRKAGR